ncbi:YdcH family protein [Ferrimonas balearica]|uniref:YdcH family protein n=1 Tax=Ferrimonas balearica TaxID=44012 RepID=UPI001C99ACF1|nr:YdcH family protein [Ferrimonas balearica]MBY5920938.1 YdcH family protein [Ferrimonas balearica]MBY5996377.1 YdcH family protein [Ferrimonas balearica]
MLGEPHDLPHEFPRLANQIDQRTESDPLFAELSEQYHQIDDEIRHLELAGSPISDNNLLSMKMTRLRLKDRLYDLLTR